MQDNSYKVYKADFSNSENDFSSNLSEIQGINITVYSILNTDFTVIKTYFSNWVNNVMDPASNNLATNGTAWEISHTDSVNRF